MKLCTKCGKSIPDNSRFCLNCGNQVYSVSGSEPPKIFSLKCNDCNGTLEFDEFKQMTYCPYCGSRNLLFGNAEIQKEQIKTHRLKIKTQSKLDQETLKFVAEERRFQRKKEEHRRGTKIYAIIMAFLIVLLTFLIIALYIKEKKEDAADQATGAIRVRNNILNEMYNDNYLVVNSQLEDYGFTNVSTISVYSQYESQNNQVFKITVDGNSDLYDLVGQPDANIKVYYYSNEASVDAD